MINLKVRLKIGLVFAILTIATLISESLLGNISMAIIEKLLWQFSKSVWASFYHKLA